MQMKIRQEIMKLEKEIVGHVGLPFRSADSKIYLCYYCYKSRITEGDESIG